MPKMNFKNLVASITKCLRQLLDQDDLTADSRESLEVSIQCLESAYGIQISDAEVNFDILQMFNKLSKNTKETILSEATPENKAEAENLKNQGNEMMKNEKYQEALINYTKAIELDNRNAVFYFNRAFVHITLGNHQQAITDCQSAISIDPTYSKAYKRLGLAYFTLEKYKEAKESYEKALELEPDNESLKSDLQLAEEKIKLNDSSSAAIGNMQTYLPNMDLSSLLSSPSLMNIATQMLSLPTMQNMMCNLMSGSVEQGGRMDALIEAGQQMAQQMQNANPELIESLRRQMGRSRNDNETSEKKNL